MTCAGTRTTAELQPYREKASRPTAAIRTAEQMRKERASGDGEQQLDLRCSLADCRAHLSLHRISLH